MDKVKQWMYYLIIGIVSLIALCFLPMVGSTVGLSWNLPNTFVGWLVWIVVKLVIAALNVTIFHCFMLQAKVNVRNEERYQEALDILRAVETKQYIPMGPEEWTKKQYEQKGVVIFITTALSTIALTQAILTFDWMAMLTYLFTIIMGLIFGVIQMKTAEEYWTDEFWQYAQKVKKDLEVAASKDTEQKNDPACNNSRDHILEPSMANYPYGPYMGPMVVDPRYCNSSFLGGPAYPGYTPSTGIYPTSEQANQQDQTK